MEEVPSVRLARHKPNLWRAHEFPDQTEELSLRTALIMGFLIFELNPKPVREGIFIFLGYLQQIL